MPKQKRINVTKQDFEAYVRVQMGGQFNMLDPRAQQATGLDKETYREIIACYGELSDKYGQKEKA